MGPTCNRCGETPNSLSMGMFNPQMICPECETIERAHPKFKEARDTELDELLKGNYNFPGIGLPKDLIVRK